MHHYKQSKKQIAIRFFTYGVMTVAVLVLSTIGILAVLGYKFDPSSGSLEQTALVQLQSQPSGAGVSIDGKLLSSKTGTRYNVDPGSHTAIMTLQGYRPWQKTFNVTAGTVLWLNYVLFIPSDLKTQTIHEFSEVNVNNTLTSPDNRWEVLLDSSSPATLVLANLNDPNNPTFTKEALPTDVMSKAADGTLGTLSTVSWDSGSRYVLLAHSVAGATEYLRFDRQNPGELKNISTQLNVPNVTKIGFSDNSGNSYYALSGTDIRKLDIGAGTISQPLVTDVTQMHYTDGAETLSYVSVKDAKTTVGIYRDAGGNIPVRTFSTAPSGLSVAYGEYYGYHYLALAHDGVIELVQSPDSRNARVVKTLRQDNVQWLYFSPNGRTLVGQTNNTFESYDIETGVTANATLGDPTTTQFKWLDDFHLVNDAGGKIEISEFDGTNQQYLTTDRAGMGVALSNDSHRLFSITANANDRPAYQASALLTQ